MCVHQRNKPISAEAGASQEAARELPAHNKGESDETFCLADLGHYDDAAEPV
jgi:hypothetical protein